MGGLGNFQAMQSPQLGRGLQQQGPQSGGQRPMGGGDAGLQSGPLTGNTGQMGTAPFQAPWVNNLMQMLSGIQRPPAGTYLGGAIQPQNVGLADKQQEAEALARGPSAALSQPGSPGAMGQNPNMRPVSGVAAPTGQFAQNQMAPSPFAYGGPPIGAPAMPNASAPMMGSLGLPASNPMANQMNSLLAQQMTGIQAKKPASSVFTGPTAINR